MGEVYLAHDERLHRQVALKQIRPEAEEAADARARERLRREARAVAALSHPAVVQLYDLIEEEDGDWIVLEYARGETLSERLIHRPLPLKNVLSLAVEICGGLSAAHEQGIIHRDLKTENIIVTPSGHAKILDFGLAKTLIRLPDEQTLSVEGKIIGTVRAMSPEQALGKPVDERSDLFSLGVLLYECLTGTAPFQGSSPMETLTKVCAEPTPDLRVEHPDLPSPLVTLIERLLSKKPEHRPATAAAVEAELEMMRAQLTASELSREISPSGIAGPSDLMPTLVEGSVPVTAVESWKQQRRRLMLGIAAAVALTLIVVLVLIPSLLRPSPTRHVAVPPPQVEPRALGLPEDLAKPEDLALELSALESTVIRTLAAMDGVIPLSPAQLGPISGTPQQISQAAAADEVVLTTLSCDPQGCRIDLTRHRGSDGGVLWTQSFETFRDDLYGLARATEAQLRRGFRDVSSTEGEGLEVAPEDYERFLRLRTAVRRGIDPGDDEQALTSLQAVRQSSPAFVEADLLEAEIYRRRYTHSRDESDFQQAQARLESARTKAPNDPGPLLGLFMLAYEAGQSELAESALAAVEALDPGKPRTLANRALLLEQQGLTDQALTTMRRAAQRRAIWTVGFDLARMECRMGQVAPCREGLEALLSQQPSNYQVLAVLARTELLSGDPARSAELYERLVELFPLDTNRRSNLGLSYLLLGRYQLAAEAFRSARATNPSNAIYSLNLADTMTLLGQEREAAELYEEVLALLSQDRARPSAQNLTLAAQAHAHLGRSRDAVANIQIALQRAPDNPSVAYEAALVFALTGERASAAVQTERALKLGTEARWFELPWFDDLREDPSFQAILDSAGGPQ